jgi:hypothetical protein
LAISVINTRSTSSNGADGLLGIGERAKTVTRRSTENARDTSSLPFIDRSGFDLVVTVGVSGNVEVNSDGGKQSHDTGIGKELYVGTDGTSSGGRARVDMSTMDGSLRSSQLDTSKSRIRREGNVRSVSLRSLMATFTSTSLSSISVAYFTEVGQSSRRDSLSSINESRRRVQKIHRRESVSAPQVIVNVNSRGRSGILSINTTIAGTSTEVVCHTNRERRRGKTISVLLTTADS